MSDTLDGTMSGYLPDLLTTTRSIGGDVQQLVRSGALLTRVLVERLVDDADDAPETVEFSYRGVDYEVDLSARNARALDRLLAPYLQLARHRRQQPTARRPVSRTPRSAPVAKAVRAWARSEGIAVSDRGRVAADVIKRYQDAHGG
jgi:hypothetical protein